MYTVILLPGKLSFPSSFVRLLMSHVLCYTVSEFHVHKEKNAAKKAVDYLRIKMGSHFVVGRLLAANPHLQIKVSMKFLKQQLAELNPSEIW